VDEQTGCPDSYDELVERYFLAIRKAVSFLPSQDQEDAAQELYLRVQRAGWLEKYDPSRRARFATFLKAYLAKAQLDVRDGFKTYARRNPVRLEDPVDGGRTRADDLAPSTDGDVEAVEVHLSLDQSSARLATIRADDGLMLSDVYFWMLEDFDQNGSIVQERIAKQHGVKKQEVGRWIKQIREVLREAGAPVPVTDGRPWRPGRKAATDRI
jgi:DNA-directed RNA polymerase specialized sigma24 family protein